MTPAESRSLLDHEPALSGEPAVASLIEVHDGPGDNGPSGKCEHLTESFLASRRFHLGALGLSAVVLTPGLSTLLLVRSVLLELGLLALCIVGFGPMVAARIGALACVVQCAAEVVAATVFTPQRILDNMRLSWDNQLRTAVVSAILGTWFGSQAEDALPREVKLWVACAGNGLQLACRLVAWARTRQEAVFCLVPALGNMAAFDVAAVVTWMLLRASRLQAQSRLFAASVTAKATAQVAAARRREESWRARYEDAVKAGLVKQCWDEYHARLRAAYETRNPKGQREDSEHTTHRPSLCVVCLEKPVQAAFFPCAHRCACMECAQDWSARVRWAEDTDTLGISWARCPYCSSRSKSFCRVYDP